MTTDSLLAKAEHGSVSLNSETVVVMDEAGMADTQRLAGLVELTERSDSKLVLVGDQAQLSPIGAGGMFGELQHAVPDRRAEGGPPRRAGVGTRGVGTGPRGQRSNTRSRHTSSTSSCTSQRPVSRPPKKWSRRGVRIVKPIRVSAR